MRTELNIAIICDSIDTTLGGSYISAQRFAKGLAEQGHHIIRCTSTFLDVSRKKDFAYAKVYEFSSISPIGPQHVRFAYPRVSSLTKIFQQEKIDIVYNIHPSYIGRQAYRVAKKMRLPIVSHSHIYTQLLLPGLSKFLQKGIKNLIARFYRKCDGIIYPTDFAKKDFEGYHLGNKEIVISNGVDIKLFHPIEKIHEDAFTILHIGRLDPEKNINLLFEALYLLKSQDQLHHNVQCTIVGSGSEEKKLHALVDEYELAHLVHFTGKVDQSHVVHSFQHASVYVLTSLYELESMTTLEAMACGCPIMIADSQHSAAKFFVQDNGYLFHPHDPKDLANRLHTLISNPNMLETLREKSIQNVAEFSFTKSLGKLESFFMSFVRK